MAKCRFCEKKIGKGVDGLYRRLSTGALGRYECKANPNGAKHEPSKQMDVIVGVRFKWQKNVKFSVLVSDVASLKEAKQLVMDSLVLSASDRADADGLMRMVCMVTTNI